MSLIRKDAGTFTERARFAKANVDAVNDAVAGRGPDNGNPDATMRARMVVNIASTHVPAFCEASRRNQQTPYKNGYDLKKYRVGDGPPTDALKTRELVDRALPIDGQSPANVYFGAVELNGTGVRFYGDVCFVLAPATLPADTVLLDRNSYDLMRSPIREIVDKHRGADQREKARKDEAQKLSGRWGADLGTMAAVKALGILGMRRRRYTTGQISQAIREDEDFMEVLKIGSFGVAQLQEARLSGSDAAHDALVGDRLQSRPAPRLESLLWRERRRRAEQELRSLGVRVRVITNSGRTKD
jgi:hypothetical protein